jgi:hypothetical protein
VKGKELGRVNGFDEEMREKKEFAFATLLLLINK